MSCEKSKKQLERAGSNTGAPYKNSDGYLQCGCPFQFNHGAIVIVDKSGAANVLARTPFGGINELLS